MAALFGSNTTTNTSQPPAAFLNAYEGLINSAQGTASQPLQQYSGPVVAGLSGDQTSAINTIQGMQGAAAPALNEAAGLYEQGAAPISTDAEGLSQAYGNSATRTAQTAGYGANTTAQGAGNTANRAAQQGAGLATSGAVQGAAAANQAAGTNVWNQVGPVTAGQIQNYESPYTQSVVNATQAQFNNQNAQQAQQLKGNAISSGAFGGDRAGVAQAILAGQQQLAQAPTIAGLENQGYSQALGEANTQQALQANLGQTQAGLQASTALGAGNLLSNTGVATGQLGANTALGAGQLGANTQLGAGQLGANTQLGAGQLGLGGTGQQLQADQANAANSLSAGSGIAGLGSESQTLALQGAQAQFGVGQTEQNQEQQQLNVPYQQFLQQQQFPYQDTSWLSGIETGLGSAAGGSGSATGTSPSTLSQLAPFALAAASFFAKRGGAIVPRRAAGGSTGGTGGSVPGYDTVAGIDDKIPDLSTAYMTGQPITRGSGPPKAPQVPRVQDPLSDARAEQLGKLASKIYDKHKGGAGDPGLSTILSDQDVEGLGNPGQADTDAAMQDLVNSVNIGDIDTMARRGGAIHRRASGGRTHGYSAPTRSTARAPTQQQSRATGTAGLMPDDMMPTRASTGAAAPMGLFGGSSAPSMSYGRASASQAAPLSRTVGAPRQAPPMFTPTSTARGVAPNLTSDYGNAAADSSGNSTAAHTSYTPPSPLPGPPPTQPAGTLTQNPDGSESWVADGATPQQPSTGQSKPYQIVKNPTVDTIVDGPLPFLNPLSALFKHGGSVKRRAEGGEAGLSDEAETMADEDEDNESDDGSDTGLGDDQPFVSHPIEAQPEGAKVAGLSGDPDNIAAHYMTHRPSVTPSDPAADKSEARREALLAASFGMMASRQPGAISNLGVGGLEGLKTYENVRAQQAARQQAQAQQQQMYDYRQGTLDQKADRLAQEIKEKRDALAQQGKHIENQDQHTTNADALAKQRLTQGDWNYLGPSQDDATKGVYLNKKTNETKTGPLVAAKPTGIGDSIINDADAEFAAKQALTGDSSALSNWGMGTAGTQNRVKIRSAMTRIAAATGLSPEDLAAKDAEYFGTKSGERTLGTRSANIEMAVNEASNMGVLARQASDALPRTGWMPINSLLNSVRTHSDSDLTPQTRAFGAALNSYLNAYATAVGKGTMTVDARNHADKMLGTADGPKAFNAVMDQLDKEMVAARAAPGQVRQALHSAVTGRDGAPAAPTVQAPGTKLGKTPDGRDVVVGPDGTPHVVNP